MRKVPLWVWVCVFVLGCAVERGVRAGSDERPGLDYLRYLRAGTLVARGEGATIYDAALAAQSAVWNDRERLPERTFRYPPVVAVQFAPLGTTEPGTAWRIWSAACTMFIGIGFAAAGGAVLTRGSGPTWMSIAVLAALLLPFAPMFIANILEGQMNCFVLALAAGCVLALARGRDRTAGVLAGCAAAIKLVPVLLLLWLAWTRRWRALLWGAGAALVLFWLLPVAALGPSTAHGLLRQWAALPEPLVTEVDERPGTRATVSAVNVEAQSLRGILVRACTPTPYFRLRDRPLEPDAPGAAPGVSVHGGRRWSPGALMAAWLAATFALLATAVFATAPIPGEERAAAARRIPLEAGLVLALVPLLAPESRWLHFLVLAPAAAAVAASLAAAERRGRAWWAAAAAGVLGAILLVLPAKEGILGRAAVDRLLAHGVAGWGGILLFSAAAITLFAERASGREPSAAPPGAPATAP